MSKLSSLTLAAALLSSLALPAMAQGTVHGRPVVRHTPKHAIHKVASTAVAPSTETARPMTAAPNATGTMTDAAKPGQPLAAPIQAVPTQTAPVAKPVVKSN